MGTQAGHACDVRDLYVLTAGLAQSRSQKITVPFVGDHRSLVSVVSRSRPGVLHHVCGVLLRRRTVLK